jgi:hypothetical protein
VVECSLCGGRAVYYRSSSGHFLCTSCLGRVLERAIRRTLSPLGALKPGSRILIPVTYYNTLASLALLGISLFMKRGYGSVIQVAIPDFIELKYSGKLGRVNTLRVSVDPKPCYEDPVLAVHYDRLWSLRLASLLGYNVILMPLTRTDLTLLALEIPLRGHEAWGMLSLATSVNGVMVVNALADVEAEPIASYATLLGFDFETTTECRVKLRASHILRELRGLGPEVEFSSRRTLELILNTIKMRSKGRCVYCGEPVASGDVCELCNIIKTPTVKILPQP